jgi:quinol monooxygenase YgiN
LPTRAQKAARAKIAGNGYNSHVATAGKEKQTMIGVRVKFAVKDEVRKQLADIEAARKHIGDVVEGCRKIPGLKEKFFVMNPKTLAQGAFLIWETQAHFEAYLKSEGYKATVLDICQGKPDIETYVLTATLTDGVLI